MKSEFVGLMVVGGERLEESFSRRELGVPRFQSLGMEIATTSLRFQIIYFIMYLIIEQTQIYTH
jgi:hypothetical protein